MIGQSAPWGNLQRVDIPNGCAAIQKNDDSLEKWTNENLIKYQIGIWQVLYLRTNTVFQIGILYEANQLGRNFAKKEIWVLVAKKIELEPTTCP